MEGEADTEWNFSAPQWHDFSRPDTYLEPNILNDDYFG